MRAIDIIHQKRDRGELSRKEIKFFTKGFNNDGEGLAAVGDRLLSASAWSDDQVEHLPLFYRLIDQ
jgi:thymidine phosphorylase